jgi:hypothetical protein
MGEQSKPRDTGTYSTETSEPQNSSAFTRNITALLERTEYRRCDAREDMEAVYRLRYKAYRTHGLVSEKKDHMISDSHDEAPNCYQFGIFVDDNLVSTVRLHHLTWAEPYGPVMSVFGDILAPRMERGETFINPSQLTADPDWTSSIRALPYLTLRLAVIANSYFKSTNCVCMIREDHTAFYRRIFGSVQVGHPRPYPPFTVPVMLYDSDCSINLEKTVKRFPFFRSMPVEQRMLFAKPARGELAPLTILPSLKYVREAA